MTQQIDFKEMYEDWLDSRGGITAAMEASRDGFEHKSSKHAIHMEDVQYDAIKRGSTYVFDYVDEDMVKRVREGKVPYFDFKPLVIAIVRERDHAVCVNLNAISPQARKQAYAAIFKLFQNDVIYNVDKKHDKWKEINRLDENFVKRAARLKTGAAFCSYDFNKMRKLRAVCWESIVIASTFYAKHGMLFNDRKNINMPTLWQLA